MTLLDEEGNKVIISSKVRHDTFQVCMSLSQGIIFAHTGVLD